MSRSTLGTQDHFTWQPYSRARSQPRPRGPLVLPNVETLDFGRITLGTMAGAPRKLALQENLVPSRALVLGL